MDKLWLKVMDKYHYTCTWPGCWSEATCVHEEPPKSLKKREERTMFPLCQEHHEYVTRHREGALERLQQGVKEVLEFFGGDYEEHDRKAQV